MEEIIQVICENNTLDEFADYSTIPSNLSELPDIIKPLLFRANEALLAINKMLYTVPAFINLVKATVPKEMLAAVLTDNQKVKIVNGALQLMTKKDGSLLATLIDPVTKHTVANIPLQNIKISPEIGQAMANYSSQMQIAQIAEKIELVQKAVESIWRGQEYDRLATAFSCQQKFLQVSKFRNLELKNTALLRIAMDAEDSRNLLMQSQKANVNFIIEQPASMWKKIIKGANPREISSHLNEIRDSLYAVNAVSLVEAIAYQEMGEMEAAQQSLKYYGEHIQSTYLDYQGLVERLDQIDDSPENYWSEAIPEIKKKIEQLPVLEEIRGLGE